MFCIKLCSGEAEEQNYRNLTRTSIPLLRQVWTAFEYIVQQATESRRFHLCEKHDTL